MVSDINLMILHGILTNYLETGFSYFALKNIIYMA